MKYSKYSSEYTNKQSIIKALSFLAEFINSGDLLLLDKARIHSHLGEDMVLTKMIIAAMHSNNRTDDIIYILEIYKQK